MPKITAYLELVDNMSSRFEKIEAATRRATAAAEMLETAHASSAGAASVDMMSQRLEAQEAMLERQGAVVEELRARHDMLATAYGTEAANTQKTHNELARAQMAEMKICEAADRTAAQIERQKQESIAAAQAIEQAKRAQEEMTAKAAVMGDAYGQSMNEISSQLAKFSDYAYGMDLELFKPGEIERYTNQINDVNHQLEVTKRAQEMLNSAMASGDTAQMSTAMKNYDLSMQKLISSIQKAETDTEKLRATEWQRIEALEQAKRAAEEAYAQDCYEQTKRKIMEMQSAHERNTVEINASRTAQDQYTNAVKGSGSAMDNLLNKAKGLFVAYLGIRGLKNGMGASDAYVTNSARIGIINDGLQTQEQLQEAIYQAAQRSMSGYNDMLNTVADLSSLTGKIFANNNQAVQFAEVTAKAFRSGGADAKKAQQIMDQLTRSMSIGKITRGDFKSIATYAPEVVQAMSECTGKSVRELEKLASQGKLSADAVKNSFFKAGTAIEDKFAKMPMTFEGAATRIKNHATNAFGGVMEKANELLNSETGQEIINRTMVSIDMLAAGASELIDRMSSGAGYIRDNWDSIAPVLGIVATAVGILAAGYAAYTVATNLAALGTMLFNTTLLGCPIFWIIAGVVGLIAIIYKAVDAFNNFAGTSVSATGVVCGAIAVAGAFIWNIIVGVVNAVIGIGVELYNLIASFANFFANVFNDPVGAIIKLFSGMFDFILGIVQAAASLIDTVLGSDLVGAVNGFRNNFADRVNDIVGEQTVVMEKKNASDYQFSGLNYGDAWDAGYDIGKNLEDKVKGVFAGDGSSKSTNIAAGGSYNYDDSAIKDIGGDTKKISKSVESSEEDLKWLKDIAEQEAINRFTTATLAPKLEVNIANVNENADVDGITDQLTRELRELISVAAEGA